MWYSIVTALWYLAMKRGYISWQVNFDDLGHTQKIYISSRDDKEEHNYLIAEMPDKTNEENSETY